MNAIDAYPVRIQFGCASKPDYNELHVNTPLVARPGTKVMKTIILIKVGDGDWRDVGRKKIIQFKLECIHIWESHLWQRASCAVLCCMHGCAYAQIDKGNLANDFFFLCMD